MDGDFAFQQLLADVNQLRLADRISNRIALSGEKCKAHSPSNNESIHSLLKSLDNTDFVTYLCTTEYRHERSVGFLAHCTKHFDFTLKQSSCCGGQCFRWTNYRCMRTMCCAECVIDIEIKTCDKFRHKTRIICFFAWVESKIL